MLYVVIYFLQKWTIQTLYYSLPAFFPSKCSEYLLILLDICNIFMTIFPLLS